MSEANVKMKKVDYVKAIVKHIDDPNPLGKLGPLLENCLKCGEKEVKDERLRRYFANVIQQIEKQQKFNPFVFLNLKENSLFYPFEALFLEAIFQENKLYLVKDVYSRWIGVAAKELDLFKSSFEILDKELKELHDELGLKATLSISNGNNRLSIDFHNMEVSGIIREDEYSGALIYKLENLVLNPSTLYLFQILYNIGVRDIQLEKDINLLELGNEGHPLEQLLKDISYSTIFLKNNKQLGILGIKVLENNSVMVSPSLSIIDERYYYNGVELNSDVEKIWRSLADEEV